MEPVSEDASHGPLSFHSVDMCCRCTPCSHQSEDGDNDEEADEEELRIAAEEKWEDLNETASAALIGIGRLQE